MNQTKFPPGWDEKRVQRVLAHYEEQTEEEAVAYRPDLEHFEPDLKTRRKR